MEEVIIYESTDYKKLEKKINDFIKYKELNDDGYNGIYDTKFTTTVIKNENNDDIIYYTVMLFVDYEDEENIIEEKFKK